MEWLIALIWLDAFKFQAKGEQPMSNKDSSTKYSDVSFWDRSVTFVEMVLIVCLFMYLFVSSFILLQGISAGRENKIRPKLNIEYLFPAYRLGIWLIRPQQQGEPNE